MEYIIWSVALAVISIVACWIITLGLRKSKKPVWYCKMNHLIQKGNTTIDGLDITYQGSKINNLSSIYVAFWNNGKETITNDAIAENIEISVSNGKIYDAQIVHETNLSNKFQPPAISEDGTSADIKFRYIDYKQGVVIQLISDCDEISGIKLRGEIMGCKPIEKCLLKRYEKSGEWILYMSRFPIILALGSLIVSFMVYDIMALNEEFFIVLAILNAIAMALFVILMVWSFIQRLPKSFRKYF